MKKYLSLILIVVVVLMGATATLAQRDSDGDGIADSVDECPNTPGTAENDGCPAVTIVTPIPADSDGDGLPDPDDQCPTVPGPRENGGCPVPTTVPDQPDTSVPPSEPNPTVPTETTPEPFAPTSLPNDGCYITTNDDVMVNVRQEPNLAAAIIGVLNPGTVYPSPGYVMVAGQQWFVYINAANEAGYVSGAVVNFTSLCPEIPYEEEPETLSTCLITVGFDASLWAEDPQMPDVIYAKFLFLQAPGTPIPAGTQADAVVLIQNFITVPDPNNVFAVAPDMATYEAALELEYAGDLGWPGIVGGMFSSMDDDETTLYRLSADTGPGACGPITGELDDPTTGQQGEGAGTTQVFEVPENCWWVPGNEAGVMKLQCRPEIGGEVAFVAEQREPAMTPALAELVVMEPTASEGTDTFEYCIVEQVGEAGIFQEVCYEIEVPEGCVVYQQEAGVWQMDCSGQTVGTIDGIGLTSPIPNEPIPMVVQLQLVYGGTSSPQDPPTQQPEYCVYEEVQEAGVFEEVCYPIEVPEGCWLETVEAGVWDLVCPPELGGDMSFAIPSRNQQP